MSYRSIQSPISEQICDLSNVANKLMAYEDISDDLSEEQENKLVEYIRRCFEMSYDRISKRYDYWKEADRAHDVYVPPDATEFREKAVIADTRAISDTVLTYLMAALTGRNPMFQLEGTNRKSRTAALIMERVLHQQIRRTGGEARIAQLLLDSIRYGFGPTKVIWDPASNQNRIINCDPYRTFPDPRVTWGDVENMQFIGFTDWKSYSALCRSGLYPRIKKYPALRNPVTTNHDGWNAHKFNREEGKGLSIDPSMSNEKDISWTLGDARSVDEIWMVLDGYQLNLPQIEQIYLVATVLDESVLIRFQASPYGRQFPYVIGGLFNDAHKTYSQSLYDLLMPLHNIATWLLRSRVDNVQAAMTNLIFADPTVVSIPDLVDRNPWGIVRTLQGQKPGDGVFIAQVPDVTRGHWDDIMALSELKQRVSAASDAQQGVPTPDVRTATEIARLTQLGSQRLGVLSRVISAMTIRPLATMMVGNIQDALAFQGSIKVDPDAMPSQLKTMANDGYIDYDHTMFQGEIDYLVIDGTLPVEPTRNADTWISILQTISQTGLQMEYDVGRIAEEAIRSMGVTDLDRFRINQQELQQNGLRPNQQFAMLEKLRGASVLPNEDVQSQVQRGNLIPMRGAA